MATAHFGSHALKDLLAINTSIQAYGEQRMVNAIQASINAHNAAINQMLNPLVEFTADRLRPYGSTITTVRVRGYRADEIGAVDVQRTRPPSMAEGNIGLPLERWQFAWQFTRDYVETATPRDAALRLQGVQQGDLDRIEYELKNAFFNPVNNTTYRDYLLDQLQLPIRRLANADGSMLPTGPNGEIFNGGSHQHYMGRAGGSVAASDISALINNVVEHGPQGQIVLYINMADEPSIRAMANFWPFPIVETYTPVLAPGTEVMRDAGPRIPSVNPPNPDNMAIGRWDAKWDIWTKPWIPQGYFLCLDLGRNPIGWRSRATGFPSQVDNLATGGYAPGVATSNNPAFGAAGRAALRIVGEHDHFPLRAQWIEREFGMSAVDRVGAAILYGGGTSYVMPTIALPAL